MVFLSVCRLLLLHLLIVLSIRCGSIRILVHLATVIVLVILLAVLVILSWIHLSVWIRHNWFISLNFSFLFCVATLLLLRDLLWCLSVVRTVLVLVLSNIRIKLFVVLFVIIAISSRLLLLVDLRCFLSFRHTLIVS
jgi:hypothetical protein